MRRDPLDEIDQEIEHHIRERADLLMAQGMHPDEARQEAARRFGDADRLRREIAEIQTPGRWSRWVQGVRSSFSGFLSDLHAALRSLLRTPAFSLAVLVTLSLGAAGATSIFSVVDAVLLRPLAYADADRWMEVNSGTREQFNRGLTRERFEAWREVSSELAELWVAFYRRPMVRVDGTAEPLTALAVTPGAITALGVPLLMGRGFVEEDGDPGGPEVVVLSRAYWERTGSDPDIVGRTLLFESGPATVVGVMAQAVKVPDYGPRSDVWIPLRDDFTAAGKELRGVQGAWVRRPADVPFSQVEDRVLSLTAALTEARPSETSWSVYMTPLGRVRGGGRGVVPGLWIVGGTVALLLIIAVVSAVNLVLVRTSGRLRELAVRSSLGGSRARVGRQLLAEGILLGVVSSIAAILVAGLALRAMTPLLPRSLTFFAPHEIVIEGRTMAFAVGVTTLCGLILGLVPSLRRIRLDPLTSSRTGGGAPSQRRLRRGLVAAQIALSAVVLGTAALLARSLSTLLAVDPGFDVERVAMLEFELPDTRYGTRAERGDFLASLVQRLEGSPGVEAVGVSSGTGFSFGVELETEDGVAPEEQPLLVPNTYVDPGFLEAFGYRVEEGRGFAPADRGRPVAVVDRDLAGFLWGGESAVGRRFRVGQRPWVEVVGVVGELRLMGRDQRDGPYQILYPTPAEGPGPYMQIGVRTREKAGTVLPVVREAVATVDPWLALIGLRTAKAALAEEEGVPRFLLILSTVLAGMAVLLASVGLYGVLAYTVRQRTRELGVRMAVGARAAEVRRMVLRDGLLTAGIGIILGIVGTLLAADVLASQLYEVRPRDPWAFGATILLLALVAVAASYGPARRATRIDPAEALRAD